MEYRKPELISRKLNEETQKAQIAIYEDLLNSKGDDEVVLFVDAVHPTHAARPVGCGRRRNRTWRSNRRAGANASTSTALSIWKPARPV